VAINKCILEIPVLIVLSISFLFALDNPITSTLSPTSSNILFVAMKSPSDEAGNPASITSTPSSTNFFAIRIF
jgi:hypothetical protein